MGIRVVTNKNKVESNSIALNLKNIAKVVENKKKIESSFADLHQKTIFYCSDGYWSAIDLLAYLILQLPNVEDIYISTFSISEKAANNIDFIKNNSNIRFHLLVDWKMKLKNPDVVLFLENICDSFGFSDCHSKLTCLVSPEKTFTVLSSANYTKNKRFESGVVVSDAKVCKMYSNKIIKLIEDGFQQGSN